MSNLKAGALAWMRRTMMGKGYKGTHGAGWLTLARMCGMPEEQGYGKGAARAWLSAKFDPDGKLERRSKPKPAQPRAPQNKPKPESPEFLGTYEWRRLRIEALKKYGATCQCCGASRKDGVRIHVDHIKPRKLFPELALDLDNLQVLCEECNHGKGNWDQTDWR